MKEKEVVMEAADTVDALQPSEPKPTNWPKIILAVVLGSGLLATSAYAGYWYGIQQDQQPEQLPPVSQPASSVGVDFPLVVFLKFDETGNTVSAPYYTGKVTSIAWVSIDGESEDTLVVDQPLQEEIFMSPRVSPDHKKFIYSTYIVDGTASVEDQRSSYEEILKLCSVSKSGQTKVDILDRVISTPDDPTSIVWIIWDSASNQVIYTTETPSSLFGGSVSRTPSSKIYQVDIATKNKRLLLDDGKLYALKYLSEDGSRLYMEGPISPGGMLPTETSYVVFNLQTGVTKPISETGIEAEIGMDIVDVGGAKVIATPNLSPDSSKIAFFGGSPSDTRKLDEIPVHERNTLWVQNADGTNMRALTNEEVVRSPRWLPDGNEIVFLDTSGSVYEYSPAVKKVNVSTKQVTTLSESSGTGKPQVFAHSWGFLDWITCSD